jgi:hypothetical protein
MATTTRAPFDFGLYGMIVLTLAFLVATAYFLAIVTIADEVRWSIEIIIPCGNGLVPLSESIAHHDFAYRANFLAWPVFLATAFAIERAFSNANPRRA